MVQHSDVDHSFDEPQLLPVVYARDLEEAEQYRTLLEDHDIVAKIDDEVADEAEGVVDGSGRQRGVAVLVSSEAVADAELVLEARDTLAEELRETLDESSDYNVDDDEYSDGYAVGDPDEVLLYDSLDVSLGVDDDEEGSLDGGANLDSEEEELF